MLVLGGRGFVGEAVCAALDDPVTGDPGDGGDDHVQVDVTDRGQVDAALAAVAPDAVVNLVGLTPVRDPRGTTYEAVHVDGARTVATACADAGVDRLVHMSALGAAPDASTAYLSTKGRGEAAVLDADIDATVVRPSLIVDDGNPFVHACRRLAPTRMFPDLRAQVQPVYRGDVAALFDVAVAGGIDERRVDVGGPAAMSWFGFARRLYRAEGCRCVPVPVSVFLSLGLRAAEHLPLPVGRDQATYLSIDNVADENDAARYAALTSMDDWLVEEKEKGKG